MAFTVPGYQVDRLLGYGSHAEVWSGTADADGERVALKRIVLPRQGDPRRAAELITAARAEAALLAALEHPSLIRFHQYVQTPAAAVLVMELAAGDSLARLLRRRDRLTPAETAAALSPIAAALAYAHAQGVRHGDVSAANILFTGVGRPKLADLGVARLLTGHPETDRALGTPAYVDPVLAAGGPAGPASDVFSLAAVALHCLSGAGPWHADGDVDLRAMLDRAATGVIEDLAGRLANCPPAMAAVVRRALDPEPHRRGSAAEFALDLGASVPPGPVVLAAGRVPPRVGRHSAERQDPAAADAVPADLTHVARLQVRPEPAEPRRPGTFARLARSSRLAHSSCLTHLGRVTRLARSSCLTHLGRVTRFGRMGSRGGPGRPGLRLVGAVAVVLLAGVAATLGLVAMRNHDWPAPAAGRQPRPARSEPASGSSGAVTTTPATPAAPASVTAPVTPAASVTPSAPTRPSAPAPATSPPAGSAAAPIDPAAVLRQLAGRRSAAFALNRPDLLIGVYQSAALLAQDLDLLRSRVPAGCALSGLRTDYRQVRVTSSGTGRLELQATASQPPATLVCGATVRSRTLPAAPQRLALSLVRVGQEFRIASQRRAT